jgi:signal transduction histidine kinase
VVKTAAHLFGPGPEKLKDWKKVSMRWPIRFQLLVPLLVLILGVLGASLWTAYTSANQAWGRIENRVRATARSLEESGYPLDAPRVLEDIKRYSGADFEFVRKSGPPLNTLGVDGPVSLPNDVVVYDDARNLRLGQRVVVNQLAKYQDTVRLTERLRLLGQVSGGLAHQLRNGVTGARLAIQLYAQESAGQTDMAALDVALRQLTLLETNLKRFLDLGNDRPQMREICDLGDLVAEAVDLLRPQCLHTNVELRWVQSAPRAKVTADRGQLEQLIFNVLGNAVEAAGQGGSVEVTMSVPVEENGRGEREGGRVVLEIVDSGPGPPAAIADRLFDPFVTGKPEGVGLGLAVARQVAEGLGGRITWRRDCDRTCFRVELPSS